VSLEPRVRCVCAVANGASESYARRWALLRSKQMAAATRAGVSRLQNDVIERDKPRNDSVRVR